MNQKAAVAKLQELRPGFSIADAVNFYNICNFERSYIDRMIEGLRKAGLPDSDELSVRLAEVRL